MTHDAGFARTLAAGLAFGLAPVQFGLAVTVAVPALDRPESYLLVYQFALAHAVVLAAYLVLWDDGPAREPLGLVGRAYLLPLAVVFGVATSNSPGVGEAWARVVTAARPDPDPKNPAAERLGVDPPRAAPPADAGPLADRLVGWVSVVLSELRRFAARVWAGTPAWGYLLAALAGWWWQRSG